MTSFARRILGLIEALLRSLLSAPERGACWVAEAEGRVCGGTDA